MAPPSQVAQCSQLLREAVLAGNVDAVRTLLEQGLSCQERGDADPSCLWNAVSMKNFEIAELLVKNGAKVNDELDERDGFSVPSTVLQELAMWKSHKDEVIKLGRILIDHGADINSWGGYLEDSILNTAIHFDNYEFAEMLLHKGARTSGIKHVCLPAINAACLSSSPEKMLRLVLRYDPSVRRKSFVKGNPLHCLGENNFEDPMAAEILLDRGVLLTDRDEFGSTPFQRAVIRGKKQLAKLFLDRGAKVDEKTTSGESPIFLAMNNLDIDMVELLLIKGADVTSLMDREEEIVVFKGFSKGPQPLNKAFLKELAKLSFAGHQLSEKNLKAIGLLEKNQQYFNDCLKELREMESKKFFEDYTYYYVLKSLKSRTVLAEKAENVDFVKGYYFERNNILFKIYSDDLDFIFTDALKIREYVRSSHLIGKGLTAETARDQVSKWHNFGLHYKSTFDREIRFEK